MNRIEKIIAKTEGPTVIDLGCVQHDAGKATNEDWLHEHLCQAFERVIGVDILSDEVAKLNQQGYEIVQADVTEMEIDVRADTVVAGELLEHLANPGLMLERIQKHLKPGGKIVLSTPNPWLIARLIRLARGRESINDEHVAWYGPTVLRQLLSRYGYQNIEIDGTTRDHGGITSVAQYCESTVFGSSTYIITANQ